MNKFNKKQQKAVKTQTDNNLKSMLLLELNQKNNTKNIKTLNLRLEKLENEFNLLNCDEYYKV